MHIILLLYTKTESSNADINNKRAASFFDLQNELLSNTVLLIQSNVWLVQVQSGAQPRVLI